MPSDESTRKMFDMLTEMRHDMRVGNVSSLNFYADKYRVSKINKCYVFGLETDKNEEDIKARIDCIKRAQSYSAFYHNHKKESTEDMDFAKAVSIIESKGFYVMKQKTIFERITQSDFPL